MFSDHTDPRRVVVLIKRPEAVKALNLLITHFIDRPVSFTNWLSEMRSLSFCHPNVFRHTKQMIFQSAGPATGITRSNRKLGICVELGISRLLEATFCSLVMPGVKASLSVSRKTGCLNFWY